jgi:hypothetical protein
VKVLRIQNSFNDPYPHCLWIERYFLRDALGRYRELKKIPGNRQYAPGEDEILAWFRQLGVTHVEVAPEWHDTVPAKTYALKTFARHMRRVSKEAEA